MEDLSAIHCSELFVNGMFDKRPWLSDQAYVDNVFVGTHRSLRFVTFAVLWVSAAAVSPSDIECHREHRVMLLCSVVRQSSLEPCRFDG